MRPMTLKLIENADVGPEAARRARRFAGIAGTRAPVG